MLPFYRPLASCSNASNIRKLQTIKRLWFMEVYGIRGKAQLPIISLYGIGGENWLKRQHKDQFECPRHRNFFLSPRLGDFQFPIFSFPLSGVIRIGLSCIKVEKLENLGNKIGLRGSKWTSLNAPGTETSLSCPLLSISPLG